MEKIFNLYLDESGDFDKDLDREHENECIVGGILMDAASVPQEQADRFETAYKDLMSIDTNYHIYDKETVNAKMRKNRAVNRTVFAFGGIIGCMVPLPRKIPAFTFLLFIPLRVELQILQD